MELVHIHIITFNEEIMLPFTVDHYRKMFSNPKITIWDNYSTDQTIDIANKLGVGVKYFETNGMNDTIQSEVKSLAAMSNDCQWCICIDCDEECLITEEDLKNTKANIIEFQGWDIFQNVQTPWLAKPEGCRSPGYSKPCCVKTIDFDFIQFAAGVHSMDKITPKEGIREVWSKAEFNLLHYKHWSPEWVVGRSAFLANRQSEQNKQNGHSYHFAFSKETHLDWWKKHYDLREVIIDKRLDLKVANFNNDGSISLNA